MKLRHKFMLCFMAVVLVMACLLYLYVNNALTVRVQEEKADDYSAFARQLSTSLRLVTRETENSLFNQYNTTSLAELMLGNEASYVKTSYVQNCLTQIPLNVTAIESVWAVDLDDQIYFASTGLSDHWDDIKRFDTAFLSADFTLWFTDDNGEIYLKKDVYRPITLKHAGIIIAHLDKQQFLSSLNVSNHTNSMLALITAQGQPLAMLGGMNDALLRSALEQEQLSYLPVSRQVELDSDAYWLTMHPATNRSWYALQLVPMSVMLALPNGLKTAVRLGSVVVFLFAFLTCFVITRSLSRNTKRLLESMADVSRGNFETPIPVDSRDEIGELAERFRWMQGELKKVTADRILHATQKEHTQYELLELKYRSLLAQISPHFICNILSSMNALATMNRTDEIGALAIKASRYLRDNISGSEQKYTTLRNEIHFVEEYVDLYHEVYHNSFNFSVELAGDAGDCRVPTMLLQPLVENALVHGCPIGDTEQTHIISISAQIEGEALVILISDSGQGMSQEMIDTISRAEIDQEFGKKLKGFGLRGVLQRLYLLYGDRQSLRIRSKPGVETIITIRIPCQYEL